MSELFSNLGRLLRYMPRVQLRRQELRLVESAWDNLALLSSLSRLSSDASSGSDLGRARQEFASLSDAMMRGLESESLKNALDHLASRAQVCIDILVRNLFERTADIGFLATDDIIARYLAQTDPLTRTDVEARLYEYASKYSVYCDIFLFDVQGRLRASLRARPDEPAPLPDPRDAVFLQAVQTSTAPYVEHYAQHHFCMDPAGSGPSTLIYAHRVESGRTVVGTLCLQFNLADEMPAIFNAIQGAATADDGIVLALVDAQGGVIGTNDPLQLPLGWQIPQASRAGMSTVRHLGREYLLVVRDTHGFQGYTGPGWRGLAMIPMDMAFGDDDEQAGSPLMLEAARSTDLLAANLRDIPRNAAAIQAALERSVWNGLLDINRIESDGSPAHARELAFARTLLSEIGNTAFKTAQAFSSTLHDLHFVVIQSMLRDVQDRASLAMQILDRNLYERANDCRWWALTPQFVSTLRAGTIGCANATRVLQYINSLYTVYASLVLFDRHGTVVAVSKPELAPQIGQPIQAGWAVQALHLSSSQDYVVSAFEPSQFSGSRPTFVYAAAVHDPDAAAAAVLGGIGIVWDASSQLSSILADCGEGSAADDLLMFVDAAGHPISVHGNDALLSGQQAPQACLQGERIVELGGALYGVGMHRGQGYREFRVSDGYAHGLGCMALRSLCKPQSRARAESSSRPSGRSSRIEAGHGLQVATFCVAGHWLGLPAVQVLLAAPDATIANAGGIQPPFLGITQIGSRAYPVIDLRSVIAAGKETTSTGLRPVSRNSDHSRQLIVVQVQTESGKLQELALRVDALGAVLEVDSRKVQEIALPGGRNGVGLVDAVVSVASGEDNQSAATALLSRLSGRWLESCVAGLLRDFAPQDLSTLPTLR
jgi:chemotaxis signal transduction protein